MFRRKNANVEFQNTPICYSRSTVCGVPS